MKKVVLSVAALIACTASAFAADMPAKGAKKVVAPVYVSPWDFAFGGAIMSDYNFRGISQSDRGPTATAYFEPRYNVNPNLQLYAGIAGSGVNLPQNPSSEIDLYGGIRPTFGPIALDLGAVYYWYPNGELVTYANGNVSLADQSYWEIYAKSTYTFNDVFSLGGNFYFFDSWLNTGASGYFSSVVAKVNLPAMPNGIGWFISGEFGHMQLGTADVSLPVFAVRTPLPDYDTWNLGVAFTYKVLTLDLRYYDSNLSKGECNLLTGDPGAVVAGDTTPFNNGNRSNWCDAAFVAKLSFDTSLAAFK